MLRKDFYEPEKLVDEVGNHLKKLPGKHTPDYLTFVANGEPTLDINLGKEIRLLKRYGIPVAVITNASLIQDKHVREDLFEADWVSVKVDTTIDTVWEKLNRPLAWIDHGQILEELLASASDYTGKLHTETMLIDGYNDISKQLKQTASFISLLDPLKAYLSIPTRPPAVKDIKPAGEDKLTEAWHIFKTAGLDAELLTGFEGTNAGATGNAVEDILNITAVHPLRNDTMDELLKQNKADNRIVDSLIEQGLLKGVEYHGQTYYLRSYQSNKE
jgi:wyosine [tRNA(Phe)-imidazoG37] synthetase (radical SAM superfamily)